MSRRRVSLRTTLLLAGLLALAGCSGEEAPPPAAEPSHSAGESELPDSETGLPDATEPAPHSAGEAPGRSEGSEARPVPRPPRPAPAALDSGLPAPREHSREALTEAGSHPPSPPDPAPEPAGPAGGGLVSVPAGTRIKVVLAAPLSSRETRAGDTVEVRPLHDLWVDEVQVPLQGSTILGRVSVVALPDEEEGRPGILTLGFHTLLTAESEEYALPGRVTGEAAVGLLRALPGRHVELPAGTSLVIVLTGDVLLPPA